MRVWLMNREDVLVAGTRNQAWFVRVRWLHWTPRWRAGSLRTWGGVAVQPARMTKESFIYEPVVVLVVVLAVVLFLLGIMLTALSLLLVLGGLLVSACSHLVLRRPFLVEAVGPDGAWLGWWVSGWTKARNARDEISAKLEAGVATDEINPPHAVPVDTTT